MQRIAWQRTGRRTGVLTTSTGWSGRRYHSRPASVCRCTGSQFQLAVGFLQVPASWQINRARLSSFQAILWALISVAQEVSRSFKFGCRCHSAGLQVVRFDRAWVPVIEHPWCQAKQRRI